MDLLCRPAEEEALVWRSQGAACLGEGQSAAGAGLLAAGPLCLQPTPVHAAGAASQRVLLLPVASDSQGACPTAPACPRVHLTRDFFFSRCLPPAVFFCPSGLLVFHLFNLYYLGPELLCP